MASLGYIINSGPVWATSWDFCFKIKSKEEGWRLSPVVGHLPRTVVGHVQASVLQRLGKLISEEQ